MLKKCVIASETKQSQNLVKAGRVSRLEGMQKPRSSAAGLVKLAELAIKSKVKGPCDGSVRMDDYLWGSKK